MNDRYKDRGAGLESPAIDAFAITPDDSTDLPETTRALYAGTDGDITLVTKAGSQVTFTGLAAGSLLPVRAVRIHATGTTATGIVGMV